MKRIRVATLQYFIRPVTTFDQFRDQVAGLVDTAKDYRCDLLVFPEYAVVIEWLNPKAVPEADHTPLR